MTKPFATGTLEPQRTSSIPFDYYGAQQQSATVSPSCTTSATAAHLFFSCIFLHLTVGSLHGAGEHQRVFLSSKEDFHFFTLFCTIICGHCMARYTLILHEGICTIRDKESKGKRFEMYDERGCHLQGRVGCPRDGGSGSYSSSTSRRNVYPKCFYSWYEVCPNRLLQRL